MFRYDLSDKKEYRPVLSERFQAGNVHVHVNQNIVCGRKDSLKYYY